MLFCVDWGYICFSLSLFLLNAVIVLNYSEVKCFYMVKTAFWLVCNEILLAGSKLKKLQWVRHDGCEIFLNESLW